MCPVEYARFVVRRFNLFFGNFYRSQRSCGQGYVFAHVCDSVNRGGAIPACLAAGLQGGAIPACIAGGIPACLAAGLWGRGAGWLSQHALQVSRPTPKGDSLGGSVQGGSRPTPKGEVEGIRSRPTAKGKVEGDPVQAHSQGGS